MGHVFAWVLSALFGVSVVVTFIVLGHLFWQESRLTREQRSDDREWEREWREGILGGPTTDGDDEPQEAH